MTFDDPTSLARGVPRTRWWERLSWRIGLAGLLALLIGFGALALILHGRARQGILDERREAEAAEAVRSARLIDARLQAMQQVLAASAARLDGLPRWDAATLRRFVRDEPALLQQFDRVFVAGPRGQLLVLLDARGEPHGGIQVSDRRFYREALAGQVAVSEVLRSRVSGQPVLVLARRVVTPDGQVMVIGGSLELQTHDLLAGMTELDRELADLLIVVTDDQARLLSHRDGRRLLEPVESEERLAPGVADWRAMGAPLEPGGLALSVPDGLLSVAAVPSTGWMVWRYRATDQLLAPLLLARREALGWAAAVAAGVALLLGLVLRQTLLPLRQLQWRTRHLFDGTLPADAAWPTARGEVGELAAVLRAAAHEHAELEQTRRGLMGRLNSVLAAAPVGICLTRERRFELVGAEFCRLLGYRQQVILGQPAEVIFADADVYRAMGPKVAAAFAAGQPYDDEVVMRRYDGSTVWVRLRGLPVDWHDAAAGTIWTLFDITDELAQRQALEWAAGHDALTGLANRKAFDLGVARLLDRRTQEAVVAALVVIDLDHFKPINDRHGHAAGDRVLRAVAECLSASVRSDDLVARLGGDEFAVLLPNCPPAAAERVLAQVRQRLRGLQVPWEAQVLTIGASLGVAHLSESHADAEAWFRAADADCYAHKALGRQDLSALS